MIPSRAWRQQRAAVLSSSDEQLAHGTSCRERLVPRRLRRLDGHPRGTTVNRGARSGLRRIGPCRRRRQAAQDRLDRRETTLDRGGGGTPPRRASGHTPRPNRNSRVRLAGKLRARILHRRTDGGIRPAHGAVARRLRAQAIGRRKVAENSALSSFYYAGGICGLMGRIREHLHLDCVTVTGKTVGENVEGAEVFNDDVIRTVSNPIYGEGSLAVLYGNLAPDGCVIKPAAMDQRFLKHSGPALVFDDYPSMKKAVDDEDLDVTADHVLVLRNAGPQGGPGMPEWGMLPMPKKLLKQGHRDMLRMSDARMSGTSYGACVLHVSPESYIGGPLALLRNGDIVAIDVNARAINMNVSDEELAQRRAEWQRPAPRFERGYGWMFSQHIRQANEGCDFDFLRTDFGAPVAEPPIY